MTRQALAELSALLAQRAVMAAPSQVAKDALRIERYAEAARVRTRQLAPNPTGSARAEWTKHLLRLHRRVIPIMRPYGLAPASGVSRPFYILALPSTPPIQGCPEGYAI